jgi:hypothetical protein
MENIENPGKRFNIGLDAETKGVIRTDTEKRYEAAYGLFMNFLAKPEASERKFAFNTDYLVFHLNLEDDEVPGFMEDMPGVTYAADIYTIQDIEALKKYLEHQNNLKP